MAQKTYLYKALCIATIIRNPKKVGLFGYRSAFRVWISRSRASGVGFRALGLAFWFAVRLSIRVKTQLMQELARAPLSCKHYPIQARLTRLSCLILELLIPHKPQNQRPEPSSLQPLLDPLQNPCRALKPLNLKL